MSDEFDRASEIETVDRERVLNNHVNRVKEAPERYGFCNDCGSGIEDKRLIAQPDVATCFTCQSIREHRGHLG